jgi:N-methylhydantoinase A
MNSPAATSRQHKIDKRVSALKAEKRSVIFSSLPAATAIIDRDSFRSNMKFRGPAIITEYSATTVVPPGANFYLDGAANLIVNLSREKK